MTPGDTGRNVERIGHRGAPRVHLENTLPAFEAALKLAADAVELDVHVTVDGRVVVHHDPALKRGVTPSALAGRPISAIKASELATVDLGGGARIPLLSEVLELTRGRIVAYVEVKAGDIQAVVDVIDMASKLAPHIPRGVLFERWSASIQSVVDRTQARDVWPKHTLVTESRIEEIHSLGCRAIIWTVNDSRQAQQFTAWGVDGLCSDDLTLF
jgi:glycerophosphoryl diester phosphodiesterase